MTCPDIEALFGDRYLISHDPCAQTWGERADPWMKQLKGRNGVIYPFGIDKLAVEIDGHPKLAKAISALPGVSLHQDGDREKTFVFPLSSFEAVAEIVLPHRRPAISEAKRAELSERMSQINAVKWGKTDPGSDPDAKTDPTDAQTGIEARK